MNKIFNPTSALRNCMLGMALLLFIVVPVQAANTDEGFVHVSQLLITTNSTSGNIFIAASTPWSNPDGCTNSTYILIQKTATNYDLLYSIVYDAYANGDTVDFVVSGCQAVGSPTYPAVVSITVQKTS